MAGQTTIIKAFEILALSKPATPAMDDQTIKNTLGLWMHFFSRIPDQILLQAVNQIILEASDYMPGVGRIYKIAVSLMDDQPDPDRAWMLALKIKQGYAWRDQAPPRVRMALKRMGNQQWMDGELPFRRKEFIQIYQSLTEEYHAQQIAELTSGDIRGLINGPK